MSNMKKGRVAAILTALLLTGTMTACGSEPASGTAEQPAESSSAVDASSKDESSEKAESSAESSKDESKAEKKAEKTESSKSEKKTDSKAESSAAAESKTDKKNDSSAADSKPAETDKPAENKSEGGNNNAGGNTENKDDPDNGDDVDNAEDPIKFIYLQDTTAQYSGEGISVSGSVVTISKGGTYEISGSLENGQIFIETNKKKVKLHLNGVSITNKAGAAINCQNAKKLTISTMPGTVNYLEDGGTHDLDKGTIFSEDTVNLKGEGELNIIANYAHGVQSDDDILINGGTINITSAKSCLHSNDGIEINAGNLYCDGGTNGIKTDGYITVTGGSSVFLGGTREEKGAIYCDGVFTVTGGQFWAIGNTCTTPDAMTTSANVIGVTFANTQNAGTLVNVTSGGNGIFTMTSPRNFRYVVYTGPNLLMNAEYTVDYGGACDSEPEHYVYYGAYTPATEGGTFTAGNAVTFYTVK